MDLGLDRNLLGHGRISKTLVPPSHPIDGLCDLPVSLLPGDGDGAGAASALAAADLGAGQAQTVTEEAGKREIARDVGGGN